MGSTEIEGCSAQKFSLTLTAEGNGHEANNQRTVVRALIRAGQMTFQSFDASRINETTIVADRQRQRTAMAKTNIDPSHAEIAAGCQLIQLTTVPADRTDHWHLTGNWRIT